MVTLSAAEGRQRGVSLLELLVVMAVLSVLGAIIFPVFRAVYEKAHQTTCLSNQRQIALSIILFAQDNHDRLPTASAIWSELDLNKRLLACPSFPGKKVENTYVYNIAMSGMRTDLLYLPETHLLLADGKQQSMTTDLADDNPLSNISYTAEDFDKRHHNKFIASYLDGHVELTDVVPPQDGKEETYYFYESSAPIPAYRDAPGSTTAGKYSPNDAHVGTRVIFPPGEQAVFRQFSTGSFQRGTVKFHPGAGRISIGVHKTRPASETDMECLFLVTGNLAQVYVGGAPLDPPVTVVCSAADELSITVERKHISFRKNGESLFDTKTAVTPLGMAYYHNTPEDAVITHFVY